MATLELRGTPEALHLPLSTLALNGEANSSYLNDQKKKC